MSASGAPGGAHVSTLSDPLVRRVVLHVFNKHRAPIKHEDGREQPSKKKYVRTQHDLLEQYGLNVPRELLKSKGVSHSDTR
jgi:hypothetical protein